MKLQGKTEPGHNGQGRRRMKRWIAFWNILVKDVRSYYLKPPNISWEETITCAVFKA